MAYNSYYMIQFIDLQSKIVVTPGISRSLLQHTTAYYQRPLYFYIYFIYLIIILLQVVVGSSTFSHIHFLLFHESIRQNRNNDEAGEPIPVVL